MKIFAKGVNNELLYIKNYKKIDFESGFNSMKELFSQSSGIDVYEYTDHIWMLNKHLILKSNSISSPLSVERRLSKNFPHLSQILQEISVAYINNKLFKKTEKKAAETYFDSIRCTGSAVLSPNDSSSVSARRNITNIDEFNASWDFLSKRFNRICVEQEQNGDCLKFYFLKGELLAIYGVVPAHVVGDGVSSLKTLVETQNNARNKNIFYKNKKISHIDKRLDLEKIPDAGEIIRLKQSIDLNKGAMLVDLTHLLKNTFDEFSGKISKELIDANYAEITCYSGNFLLGSSCSSFYVRDIRINSADLSELFFCATDEVNTERYLSKFRNLSNLVPDEHSRLEKSRAFDSSHMKSATQLNILKEAAKRRRLNITTYGRYVMKLTDQVSRRSLFFFSGMSCLTTSLSRAVSNDKFLTKDLLEKSNINTPKGFKIGIADKRKAWELAKNLGFPLVLKPLSGSGGFGVSTDISSRKDFDTAWAICENLGASIVLIEEQVTGDDYRVIVVGNKVCAVTQRTAAHVVGDGIHTIKELITNKSVVRQQNPFYRSKSFCLNEIMVNFLRQNGRSADDIPSDGEYVQLLNAVNIGSGGESEDKTDDIHPDWINIAVEARKAILNPFHAGLDFMAEDIRRSPKDQKWSIIEVNTNPDLGLQVFPGKGSPRDVGGTLLRELFGEIDVNRICYRLTITGKVQGVGYRKWFQRICTARNVAGYVKNSDASKSVVEAYICGQPSSVNRIVQLSHDGPRNAAVTSVTKKSVAPAEGREFTQLEIH